MNKPIFSVIIPTLNEKQFIAQILHSLELQTYKDFEVLVVDNGSTDNTVTLTKSLAENLPYSLKVVHCKQRGISYARNFGYKYANGKYLVFFDADGIPCTTWLESALHCFKSRPGINALSGLYYYKHRTKWYKTFYYSIDIVIVYF